MADRIILAVELSDILSHALTLPERVGGNVHLLHRSMHPAPLRCGDPQPLGRYPGYSHKGLCTPAPRGVGRLARLATASISADPLWQVAPSCQ
jgi:hypothetical protein